MRAGEHAGGPAERQLGLLGRPRTTSGSTPSAARTPSTKSSRFSASRDADVATNRIASTPSSVQMSSYRRAASSVRVERLRGDAAGAVDALAEPDDLHAAVQVDQRPGVRIHVGDEQSDGVGPAVDGSHTRHAHILAPTPHPTDARHRRPST